MKKIVLAVITLVLVFTAGCSKKDTEQQDNNQNTETSDVTLNEIGLKYTIPKAWDKYKETNLYPLTVSTENTLAKIKYCYVPDGNFEQVINQEYDLYSLVNPICEITVFKNEDIEKEDIKKVFEQYKNSEKVAEQNGYMYYVFSDYNIDTFEFSEKTKEQYDEMLSGVPELIKSISTFDFNPNELLDKMSKINRTITFITKTLEGDDIDSSIFSDYKLTMINFWGSYRSEYKSESKVMQELYEKINSEPLTIGEVKLIQAVIDTPGNETEEIAKKAKKAVKGEYTSIVMDSTLATWAENNLNGIPTTIFVNSDAQIVGEPIEGAKTVDEYWDLLTETFNSISY